MGTLVGKHFQNHRYVLEHELGRGGFGVTYKATLLSLGQTVVVKTLDESLRQDPNFSQSQQQFQAEAKRLALCTHPNIVRVIDFFIEDHLPFIVMEYVPGQTLDTIVSANPPISEAVALQYIRQIGEALKVVHRNNLLHRDVKPQNIILRQGSNQVVLIDFGIAREFSPGLTQTHTSLVSPGYAPIEQYLPQERRSPATDVYGLAATLYTLLTAQVPIASILRDRQPLPSPRELRPELTAAVNQAVLYGMAVEPRDRPASVDDWLRLLPDALGSERSLGKVTSQVATIAISPGHRQSRQANPVSQSVTAGSSSFNWRPLLAIGLAGTAVAIAITAIVSRSPQPVSDPTPSPSDKSPDNAVPSPVPTFSAAPTTVQPTSSPTDAPQPEASPASPSPSPSVSETPTPQASEAIPPTGSETPTSIEPTAPPTTNPEPPPPEISPTPSEPLLLPPDSQEPQSVKELEKQITEQQREVEKHQKEQQREVKKHQKEQQREAKKTNK